MLAVLVVGVLLVAMMPYGQYRLPPTPILTMTDFEDRYMNETVWLSPPVYTHDRGYKIRLAVYVNGHRGTHVAIGGRGTHVSVIVHFMRGEFDDSLKWPFRGAICFRLIDQLHGEDHKEYGLLYHDKTDNRGCERVTAGEMAEGGFGELRFIEHSKLVPDYLVNNTLLFQICDCYHRRIEYFRYV